MLPIGPLMTEHRLIERMISLLAKELQRTRQEKKPDPDFIDTVADFLSIYTDKYHHGKEEEFLFKALSKKELSGEHKRILDELLKEHALARNNVNGLIEAKKGYMNGRNEALQDIIRNMEELTSLYTMHVEKEDKHFFIPSMGYLSDEEKDSMLKEMRKFDREMSHDKYKLLVEEMERRR